ncbi:histidine kinase [Saccharomonospora sp. NPDC006951]
MTESTESRMELIGLASLALVCLLVGSPVLIGEIRGEDITTGPFWVWLLAYLGWLGSFLLVLSEKMQKKVGIPALFVLVTVGGAGTVLLAPEAGWTPILLVFSTAIAAHMASRRITMTLLGVNTGIVALAGTLSGGGLGSVIVGALIYCLLQSTAVWAVFSQVRTEKISERLAVANTELRTATALLAESSRSAERLRIARELHDLLGHQLTALVLELEVASRTEGQRAADHVSRARGLAKDLLGDVRVAVGELRAKPARLREALVEMTADLPHPRVKVTVEDTVEPDETRAATLIRCVQEVVTNAIKHSEAENLWIHIGQNEDGEITLSAHDDGKGAELLRLGNGLTGVRERVEQLGGAVNFRPHAGFRIEAKVPTA